MSNPVFTVIDSEHTSHDASTKLHGAKIIASRDGCRRVGVRWHGGYHVYTVAEKKRGKWQFTQYGADLKHRGII